MIFIEEPTIKNCHLCDQLFECNGKTFGLKGVYNRYYEPWQFFEGKKNSLVWVVGINQAFNEGLRDLNILYPRFYRNGNPKPWNEERSKPERSTLGELEEIFNKWKKEGNAYYQTFKLLNPILYDWLGEEYGVASTEAIRCGSIKHEPNAHLGHSLEDIYSITQADANDRKKLKKHWDNVNEEVRKRCSDNFQKLLNHTEYNLPLLIICNGKPACRTVSDILLTPSQKQEIAKKHGVRDIFSIPIYEATYDKGNSPHKITVIQSDFLGSLPSDLSRIHVGETINSVLKKLDLINFRDVLLKKLKFERKNAKVQDV